MGASPYQALRLRLCFSVLSDKTLQPTTARLLAPARSGASLAQEILTAFLPHVPAPPQDTMSGAEVAGAKQHSFVVPASAGHNRLFAAQRPCSSEHRKEAQAGFVFKAQDRRRRQLLQLADKRPFVCARCGSFSAYTRARALAPQANLLHPAVQGARADCAPSAKAFDVSLTVPRSRRSCYSLSVMGDVAVHE